ncbi:CRDL2 protein, partial [Polypterus senegalus]
MENPEYLFSLDINQKIDSEQHQFFRNSYKEKDFLKDHVRAVKQGSEGNAHTSGDLTLLTSFLQNRLDIKVHRKKTAKTEKPHFTLPLNPKRKVTTKIPKIPKQLPILDDCYSDSLLLKLGFAQLRPAISDSIKDLAENKPLPPIGTLPQTDRKEADSEEQIHNVQVTEEQDTEAFFMTQVDDLPESEWLLNSESNEKTMSKTETKEENAVPEKYKGFEELMDARPDSTMLEPVGIQQNVRALQYALKHLLVYRDNKARLDTVQRPFMSKEKTVKPQLPEPRKSKGEKVEECLTKIKESTAITEVPLVSLLQDRKARRRKHAEALDLLKELQQNYTKVHDNALQQAAEIEKHTQDILSKTGSINCVNIKCSTPPCENPVTETQQCCPKCVACTYSGKTYSHGEVWHPVLRPHRILECILCTCKDGTQECKKMACPSEYPCEYPVKIEGKCCKTCPELKEEDSKTQCPLDDINSLLVYKDESTYLNGMKKIAIEKEGSEEIEVFIWKTGEGSPQVTEVHKMQKKEFAELPENFTLMTRINEDHSQEIPPGPLDVTFGSVPLEEDLAGSGPCDVTSRLKPIVEDPYEPDPFDLTSWLPL